MREDGAGVLTEEHGGAAGGFTLPSLDVTWLNGALAALALTLCSIGRANAHHRECRAQDPTPFDAEDKRPPQRCKSLVTKKGGTLGEHGVTWPHMECSLALFRGGEHDEEKTRSIPSTLSHG